MKKERLLDYLIKRNTYVKSKELEQYLNVSSRQIRNYVADLNRDEVIIESSNLGYKATNNYTNSNNKINDQLSRKQQIIHQLLFSENGIDLYDLSDSLYCSESTILKDLTEIKKEFSSFKLNVINTKGKVYLHGEENNKRKLIHYIISNQPFNLMYLNEEYITKKTNISLSKLRNEINKVLTTYNVVSNDFCIDNIALHLLIIIDRILKGFALTEEKGNINYSLDKDSVAFQITNQIVTVIENKYNVNFTEFESKNFYFLVMNNINQAKLTNLDNVTLDNINQFVDDFYLNITKAMLKDLEKHYLLEPFKDNFIIKLTLHIQNLYFRYNNQYSIENPLANLIKKDYPLIYDMAVYIAQKLKYYDDLYISEDEIAFISFHLGSYFQLNSFEKIIKLNCTFIYANYYDYYTVTVEKLLNKYRNYLNITNISSISNFDIDEGFNDEDIDIFIVTSMVSQLPKKNNIIQISPFLNEYDFSMLDKAIETKRNLKILREIKEYIFTFFNIDLYHKVDIPIDKETLIKKICNHLERHNYVENSYYADIMAREKLSSTVFNDVAVPHTMTTKSTKNSFISFVVIKNGIEWDKGKFVHLVVMIGVNDNSKKLFSYFFDRIIKMLDKQNNVKKLMETTNYEEICQVIKSFYDC